MKNRTSKRIAFIAISLAVSIFLAGAAGIAGFLLAFLVFGDGSRLYLALQKAMPLEPYIFVALVLSALAFLFTWIAAFALFKRTSAVNN